MKENVAALTAALLITAALPAQMAYAASVCEGSKAGVESAGEREVINTVCLVMGSRVSKDAPYTTLYKGNKIGFCCGNCSGKFESDPEAYMDNIKIQQGGG